MWRFLTAGESHGPGLTVIIDGVPAGVPIDEDRIAHDLRRRQGGYGRGGRMLIERDRAEVRGGVHKGYTTGAPVALWIENRDWVNWKDKDPPPITVPRPGHADLAGALKFGHRDLRIVGERSSARETTARVAAGAVAKAFLGELGIRIYSHVVAIGEVTAPAYDLEWDELFARAEASEVRCADADTTERMKARIDAAKQAGESLGGIFEVAAVGVPPGLGSYTQWDRKLDGLLAQAILSINAIKGVEFGEGFAVARLPGTQAQDPIRWGPGRPMRTTNRAGGLEGGTTNGEPIVLRAAMKPIATTVTRQDSVDLLTGQETKMEYQRSDVCAVPAAAVVGEAMVALVLARAVQEKFGGDHLAETRAALEHFLAARGWLTARPD
ncbi:MAG TPA: chorismate synthase [Chloroflexota bacterium]|nr:chorismate synthase [Chloroflexota bacterium]HZU05539.1 chorismate synthase [Chloroflexota bacterium]